MKKQNEYLFSGARLNSLLDECTFERVDIKRRYNLADVAARLLRRNVHASISSGCDRGPQWSGLKRLDGAWALAYDHGKSWDNSPLTYYRYVLDDAVIGFLQGCKHRNNVRRHADAIGLSYWPALIQGHVKINAKAYLIAERILSKKHGLYDGGECRGGWDMQGYYGISPQTVAKLWFAAGCKHTAKFEYLVRHHDMLSAQPPSVLNLPMTKLTAYLRADRWLNKHGIQLSLNRNATIILGRMPAKCRWAALHGVASSNKVTPALLNWDAVKTGMASHKWDIYKSDAVRHRMALYRHGWLEAKSRPFLFAHTPRNDDDSHQITLSTMNPTVHWGITPAMLHNIVQTFAGDDTDVDHYYDESMLLPVMNLARLFRNDALKALRWARSIYPDGDSHKLLHDAGQMSLPPGRLNPAWGDILAQKPSLRSYAHHFDVIERHVNPLTVATVYQYALDHLRNADLLDKYVSKTDQKYYTELMERQKPFSAVPAVVIHRNHYTLRGVSSDDVQAPLAGLLTGCCQHLFGAAASCAQATVTSPNATLWGVFDASDKMVAQAFVWRPAGYNVIVLDSIERADRNYRNPAFDELFRAAAKAVIGMLGIEYVLIAAKQLDGGIPIAIQLPLPDGVTYTDAKSFELLASSDNADGIAAEEYTPASTLSPNAVNTLLDGSGVVCEYCDAEVHPLAETCPACGRYIGDWV